MLLEPGERVSVLIPVKEVDSVKVYKHVIQSQNSLCLEFNNVRYYIVVMHVHANPSRNNFLQPTSLTYINDGLSMLPLSTI